MKTRKVIYNVKAFTYFVFFPPTAYRVHVNQSTVNLLNSLKLGYKIDVRGLTELKVNKTENGFTLNTQELSVNKLLLTYSSLIDGPLSGKRHRDNLLVGGER